MEDRDFEAGMVVEARGCGVDLEAPKKSLKRLGVVAGLSVGRDTERDRERRALRVPLEQLAVQVLFVLP